MARIIEAASKGEIITELLFVDPETAGLSRNRTTYPFSGNRCGR
jgi:hypothetical protein